MPTNKNIIPRYFYIQKGTPDIIFDSLEDFNEFIKENSCTDRLALPLIKVQEVLSDEIINKYAHKYASSKVPCYEKDIHKKIKNAFISGATLSQKK